MNSWEVPGTRLQPQGIANFAKERVVELPLLATALGGTASKQPAKNRALNWDYRYRLTTTKAGWHFRAVLAAMFISRSKSTNSNTALGVLGINYPNERHAHLKMMAPKFDESTRIIANPTG